MLALEVKSTNKEDIEQKKKQQLTQNNIFNEEIFINLPPKTCFRDKP